MIQDLTTPEETNAALLAVSEELVEQDEQLAETARKLASNETTFLKHFKVTAYSDDS